MKYRVNRRESCRICGRAGLETYLRLPPMPLTDELLRPEQVGQEFFYPIDIQLCPECLASQTSHEVNVGDYYRDYQYTTGHSPFVRRFMRELAEAIWRNYGCRSGDSVIEVGSGDGVQLACFKPLGGRVLGFEPSEPLCRDSQAIGVNVVMGLFDEDAGTRAPAGMLPAQVILLEYTFDHLAEPMKFLQTARKWLDPQRGVLVIEVHDLEQIVNRLEYCLFQHEHTIYLCRATMQRVLARAGLVMLKEELVPQDHRRGNSLVVVAAVQGSAIARDHAAGPVPLGELGRTETYRAVGEKIQHSLVQVRKILSDKQARGVRLAGYGAGGRGVMTLAAVSEPGQLKFLCDKNPSFHGRLTPVSHVPIVPPERLLTEPIDETIVFSFGYMAEIAADLSGYVNRGGKLISLLDLLRAQA